MTMQTQQEVLRNRSKQFAIEAVRLCRILPKSDEARIIGRQLLRSATSVAANYRAVGRSRSRAEFISKMGTVVEEADESAFWLELLVECEIIAKEKIEGTLREANELLAIFAASQRTAKSNRD